MKKVWLAFHPVVIADWIRFSREGEGSKMANKKIYQKSVSLQNYALSALKTKTEIRLINFHVSPETLNNCRKALHVKSLLVVYPDIFPAFLEKREIFLSGSHLDFLNDNFKNINKYQLFKVYPCFLIFFVFQKVKWQKSIDRD